MATTAISAGLAGASGRIQRQAFAAAFPSFAARRLSSDGYTAFLGVFGNDPGTLLSVGTGVVAYCRQAGGAPTIRSGWAFRSPIVAAAPGFGLRLATEYLDHLDSAATVPASSLWATAAATFGAERDGILGWLAAARAADFASLAPAVVAAATADDPLGLALLDEVPATWGDWPMPWRPRQTRRSALGGGLADVYRSRLEAALPGVVLPPTARPEPLRGAWLVATGAVPPEYPDVA